jgi:RNA polymerase sigma-70 factor (ECF subfamily)
MTMIPKPAAGLQDEEPTVLGPIADSESALVERAKDDPAAFGLLYRRHSPAIQRYLRRRVGDVSALDDLVAETFLAAQRYLGRYRDRGQPFRAWLYRLATSRLHRWLRSQRWRRMLRLESEPAITAPDQSDRDAVRRALLELAPALQACLALHYLEGLSIEEVSFALGCRPGTVKSRLARGREALRRSLERAGWNE